MFYFKLAPFGKFYRCLRQSSLLYIQYSKELFLDINKIVVENPYTYAIGTGSKKGSKN